MPGNEEIQVISIPLSETSTQQPVQEITAVNTKEEVNKALQDTAQMLLELKDTRVALASLARLAGTGDGEITPMGTELRSSFISHLQGDKKLEGAAMESLRGIQLPAKPDKSATAKFLEDHSDKLPPGALADIQLKLASEEGITVENLALQMQQYEPLRDLYFTALLGPNTKPPSDLPSVLAGAGLENSQVNLQAIQETFTPANKVKIKGAFNASLAIPITLMVIQVGSQLTQEVANQDKKSH